jgi:hypothetical protein
VPRHYGRNTTAKNSGFARGQGTGLAISLRTREWRNSRQDALELTLPAFQPGEMPTLIVATASGAARRSLHALPPSTHVRAVAKGGPRSASPLLHAVPCVRLGQTMVDEGGSALIGAFFSRRRLENLPRRSPHSSLAA